MEKKNYKKVYIGDIAICCSYLEKECYKFNKNIYEHWAHIIIHSALHLIGYKHDSLKEQNVMENIEKNIMISLGYKNPY